ncbi:MAG: LysM peptidoglycan-binding domain-containing protein [Desulfohalobiaceae bacterium]|nr:LysM peptidoglycan-binding domain-containing protein [Desulfohalobiaceae bacterium]
MSNDNWIDEFEEPKADMSALGKKTNRFKGRDPERLKKFALWGGSGLILLLLIVIAFRGCGSTPDGTTGELESRLASVEDTLLKIEEQQVKQQEQNNRSDRQEDFQVLVHRLDSLDKRLKEIEEKVAGMGDGRKQGQGTAVTGDDADFLREKTYSVQSGDTLYSISQKYGVSVDDLRRWNDLGRGDVIRPGQKLVVVPDSAE